MATTSSIWTRAISSCSIRRRGDHVSGPSTSTDPTAPYQRLLVGIDIPAGSYTITAATVSEGETDEDSAASS
ncbi:MAG: hypothetical protein ACLSDQ_06900 [Adlercreutzia equolifaciens]